MKKNPVSEIMLILLLIGISTLAFNVQRVKASKPLAPNGVHDMASYESRIGEQGLLIEDVSLQMWVPLSYEDHSRVIFDYLVAGYGNLSSIFGDHEYPYKFSIEHYPLGSPYLWGGTDARGTIRYGYSNLEDDTPEWNIYGVPHMIGYYEEMAHCFLYDFGVIGDGWGGGFSVGFYETLGLMMGSEVTLRAACNPYIEGSISDYYQVCNETTSYYLQYNTGPPGVGSNIWPTRVLSHMFKTEVVDVYGWNVFTNTFNYLQLEGYPLRQYDRVHTWGGFLNYPANQTGSDLNTIFAGYGLPSLQLLEGDGYQKGMMWIDGNNYSFRVKCFDREGNQPTDVKLHVYSPASSAYVMSFIGGNNETGWTFEANVTFTISYTYAFSARDGAHSIFQAVGLPTLVHKIRMLSVPQDYATIQEAINAASDGDTIFVHSGTYYENVVINKTVSLIGEDRSTTIIDGNRTFVTILHITANNVTVKEFTIQNDTSIMCLEGGGIYITNCNGSKVIDNVIANTQYGINLKNSTNNTIIANTIIENDVGIQFLDEHSSNNTVYHNNFINSSLQVSDFDASNIWDNGCEGNYWSNYNGTDLDGDGIGDTYLPWEGVDYYPLMNPYIEGDVNHDAIVDIFDLVLVALAYGSTPVDPDWNPHTDLNEDGVIDIFDLVIAAANYGNTW